MKKIYIIVKIQKLFLQIFIIIIWWGSAESKSGVGSTYIIHLKLEKLEQIIVKYKIKSIFDAPCGDLNWIQHIIKKKKLFMKVGI